VSTKIITVCGSMRFFREMLVYAGTYTLNGYIVLMPFVTGAGGDVKFELDELHKRKIDLSTSVLVVNIGGYIGESTRSEIAYSLSNGKSVIYVEEA